MYNFDYLLENALQSATQMPPEDRSGLGVLYHATKKELLPSIMRRGLDPMESVYAKDEEENDWEGLGPPYHFTFLSGRKTALDFMPEQSEGALLEITLPQELQDQLVLDRGEYIRAPFIIDPKYIKVVDIT